MADGYGGKPMKGEDFQEDDVWAIVKEREDSNSSPRERKSKEHFYSSGSSSSPSSAWHLPSTPRVKITRANLGESGHEANKFKMAQQFSAPVNVPDWSKKYGAKNSSKKGSMVGDGHHLANVDGTHKEFFDDGDLEGDSDDDGGEMVPPHEYIARRLARTQISSFSMCEGIGRTLKGRDLSKVRNAILSKTGFLE